MASDAMGVEQAGAPAREMPDVCDKRRQRSRQPSGLSERLSRRAEDAAMNIFRGRFARRVIQAVMLIAAAVKLYAVTHH
jgi:hypothetical protein